MREGRGVLELRGEERWRGVLELKVAGRGRLGGVLNLRGKRSLLELRGEMGRGGWEV